MSKADEEPLLAKTSTDNSQDPTNSSSEPMLESKGLSFYGVYHPDKQSKSENLLCQECAKQTWSRVESRPGMTTYLCCAYLCLVGCCCCLCYIPFCIRSCKDTYHFCANCNAPLNSK